MTADEQRRRVHALAFDAGFDLVGVTGVVPSPELGFFGTWVERGYAGEMRYLTDQRERRSDLRVAFPWARSIVCLGLQYDTPEPYSTAAAMPGRGWVARYAWGDDYHDVMKRMLERLRASLTRELGVGESRVYVDTGPVVERAWAAQAGLGAWGKNTCLLHPEHGSWFFLGEVVVDLELASDGPRTDMCGSCTACLDACPTGALPEPFVLDATRCISYLTIELKDAIPHALRPELGDHVFGCDICQDVCPWNRKRRHRGGTAFDARAGLVAPELTRLAGLSEEAFRERFRRSPIRRAKRRGLLRNVAVALGNTGDARHRPTLERLCQDADPLVREHASWALERLDDPATSGTGREK